MIEIVRFRLACAALGPIVVGVFLRSFEAELYRRMKAARANDLVQRVYGSVTETCEVGIQIVLEATASRGVLRASHVSEIDGCGINDRGARIGSARSKLPGRRTTVGLAL